MFQVQALIRRSDETIEVFFDKIGLMIKTSPYNIVFFYGPSFPKADGPEFQVGASYLHVGQWISAVQFVASDYDKINIEDITPNLHPTVYFVTELTYENRYP